HPAALRRIESVEKLVHALTIEAGTSIAYRQAHAISVFPFSSDQHLPWAIVHADHRVRGVAEQVEDDLLDLDSIAGDGREIGGELRLKNDPVSLKVTPRQRDDLSSGLIQIHRLQRE